MAKMTIANALKLVGFVERKEFPSASGVIPANSRLRALSQGLNALLSEGEAWSAGAIPVAQRLGFALTVGQAHEALAQEEATWLQTAREARKIVQAAKGSQVPAESEFTGDPIPGMAARRALWEAFASLGGNPERIGDANRLLYAFSRRTAGRNDSNRRKAIRVFETLGIDPLAAGWRLPNEADPAASAAAPAAAPAPAAAAPAASAPAPMSAADLAAALRGFMGAAAAPAPAPETDPAPATAPAPAAAPAKAGAWSQEEVDMLAVSLRKAGYSARDVVEAFMAR